MEGVRLSPLPQGRETRLIWGLLGPTLLRGSAEEPRLHKFASPSVMDVLSGARSERSASNKEEEIQCCVQDPRLGRPYTHHHLSTAVTQPQVLSRLHQSEKYSVKDLCLLFTPVEREREREREKLSCRNIVLMAFIYRSVPGAVGVQLLRPCAALLK